MKLGRVTCAMALSAVAVFSQLAIAAGGALGPGGGTASAGLFTSNPPLVVAGADPFLMIDLSVELTQQAEAFTDGSQTFANGTLCKGRLGGQTWNGGGAEFGICYSAAETYIGYFDAEKCYTYDTTTYAANVNTDQVATGPRPLAAPHFFKPAGKATNHACSGKFSGNFLNWATMTALDEFRGAMTGGARLIDTSGASAQTMLIRTRRFDSWAFVLKAINSDGLSAGGATFTTNPTTVTPFSSSNFAAPSGSSNTTTCSCSTGTATICKKSGSSDRAPSACSCSQTVATTYSGARNLVVVNNWSGLNAGTSLHRTRFYSQAAGTTTTTTTTQYTRSGYNCPSSQTTASTAVTTPTLLTVGGQSDLNVIVKVCDPTVANGGLESNCSQYTDGTNTWYKPEGLLQKNALKMKYALSSYTGRDGNGINGGVMRANAKYIGAQMPTLFGGLQDNPNAEISKTGLFVFDPDKLAGKAGLNAVAPVNSGIINYINQFALQAGRYKSNDPDAELYYEGLRYVMNLGPSPSFYAAPKSGSNLPAMTALSAAEQDGYPIMGPGLAGSPAWTDPVTSSCQKNFALYVGDKNTHQNNYIPGGSTTLGENPTCATECSDATAKGIDASALINAIGGVEGGFNSGTNAGAGGAGYGLAGLAWWANTHDIRTDLPGNQRLKTFVVDTQEYGSATPVGKGNLLWVGAKWGGFEESTKTNYDKSDNNIVAAGTALSATPTPDVLSEWNARGAVYTDGTRLPDTYTLASQPANLVSGLTQVFAAAASGSASASAAAVVSNSAYGIASVFQALYEPQLTNGSVAVGWTGLVRSFFIDDEVQVREDTDGNGKLTDADYVIKYKTDPSNPNAAIADLYRRDGSVAVSNVAVRDLKPVWNAGAQLSALSNSVIPTQRAYASSTTTGRYIRTWVDTNNDGKVDAGEEIDFTASNFPTFTAASNDDTVVERARLLGLDSSNAGKASNLVNYVRGQEISGLRNRTIDMGDGKGALTRRLGDIVHSAPLVVGVPEQAYDADFGDTSYATFKSKYANRRSVVYVGANDGMLHAFNAGFFDPATKSYSSSDSQPLGGELWAYVPYNLLPHLQWLVDPLYQHVFYVDGTPQSFDVNMFSDDADHPGGWGTILVVGFRMGGGEIKVNATRDQLSATDVGNRTLRPAYVVFDITNPEKAPRLLAEISSEFMGHTVGLPTVIKRRVISGGNATANQWYLAMGNGPKGTDATTSQTAHDKAVSYYFPRIFLYDLNDTSKALYENKFSTVADPLSFVGDMASMDWDKDYNDEVVYFGTVGNTDTSNPKGNLWRMLMPDNYSMAPTFSMVLSGNSSSQPFSAAPLPMFDRYNRRWVFAGAGRFYTSSDVLSAKQMSYYGLREGSDLTSGIPKTDLVNTTGIRVSASSNKVADPSNNSPFNIAGQSVGTFPQLVAAIEAKSGWFINFDSLAARNVERTLNNKSSLLFIEYTASNDACAPAGSSRLFAPNLLTGTASPFAALGISDTLKVGTESASTLMANTRSGRAFLSGVIKIVNASTGEITSHAVISDTLTRNEEVPVNDENIVTRSGRTSWRELPLPKKE